MWLLPCRDQQQHLSYQNQWQVVQSLAYPGLGPQLLPRQPAEPMLPLALQPPAQGQQQPANCPTLVRTYCFTEAPSALGSCWTSFHKALEENFRGHFKTINAYTSKVEFTSSNIFPCTGHHLLRCSSPTTQHWYAASMRITYSEYVQPFFSHYNFILN